MEPPRCHQMSLKYAGISRIRGQQLVTSLEGQRVTSSEDRLNDIHKWDGTTERQSQKSADNSEPRPLEANFIETREISAVCK